MSITKRNSELFINWFTSKHDWSYKDSNYFRLLCDWWNHYNVDQVHFTLGVRLELIFTGNCRDIESFKSLINYYKDDNAVVIFNIVRWRNN